ncbi:hypothetical protein EXU85_20265 [Spirosoma sp. KCTC 42546]|uniref:hypothetical protein n=1 Tax=Spirosoma sp. KCTC 42546 TaxID=2520506 RepID=UPI0011581864|nr:hypothetical protein [Spirosoma sp. KCTC 42546]QDK80814.1 hypothetical protein EXU85_20265 [Spirosoma sp. KCTC 42546]
MIFFITTLDRQGDYRHFHFDLPELETGLEVLNRIVAKGEVLVNVTLIDGSSIIHLPIAAFDGQPCQAAIHALELDWRELLNSTIDKKG